MSLSGKQATPGVKARLHDPKQDIDPAILKTKNNMKQKQLQRLVAIISWSIVIFLNSIMQGYGQNLALGKTVFASPSLDPTLYPNTNLVDGDFNTFAHTNNTASPPNGEWFQIDLGADYFIDSVVIGCRANSTRLRRFMLVTWSSEVGSSLGANPNTYLSNSLYNRLIYTDPSTVTQIDAFGTTATNSTVPGTAGNNLGPVFPGDKLNFHIGIHKARYVLLLNLQDDYFDPTELQVFAAPPPVRAFTNEGFEQGPATSTYGFFREGDIPGWSTTDASGMFSTGALATIPTEGSFIERWQSGFSGISAYMGNYFAELNAFTNGMLEQQPICVRAGENFNFSFAHRGRSGVDVMRLRIDEVDVAEFSDNNVQTGTHSYTVLTPATITNMAQDATTATGWTRYSGTWTNTSGTNKMVSFGYRAVSSAGGNISYGNFIDSVTLTNLSTLISFDNDSTSGLETVPSADLPQLLLNGRVTTASTIQLNITGGTATRGTDYTTTPASGLITVTIPVGSYDGTAATAVSLAPYIHINTDQVSPEPGETIEMTLQNPSTGLAIADAASCALPVFNNVYTILNVTPPEVVNDTLTGQTQGNAAIVPNILANDTASGVVALSPDSISLVVPAGATNSVVDAKGHTLGFTVPGEGAWSLNSSTGAVTFTPQSGFTDDPTPIRYAVTDNTGMAGNIGTIVVMYNHPPVAINDIVTTPMNTQLSGDIATNDTCGVDGPCSYSALSSDNPRHGIVTIDTNGTYTYTPTSDFTGRDTFSYVLCNSGTLMQCDTAKVFITINAPLPVQLLSFTARAAADCDVWLTWATGTETQFDHFEIETGRGGRTFAKDGSVAAKGSGSSYAYRYHQDVDGTHYFRLKIIDTDGSSSYSPVAVVTNDCGQQGTIVLMPNPAHDRVQLRGLKEDATAEVFDLAGRCLLRTGLDTQNIELNISKLPVDNYLVRVKTMHEVQTFRLSKQ